jgi:hypothetical protein
MCGFACCAAPRRFCASHHSPIYWRECIEYLRSKTGHDLSKTAFFKIKIQLKSEGRDWVFRLRDDHD